MEGEPSFIPKGKQTHGWKGGPYGATLHFGIRENGMGMILNGIALEGLTRPYGGTFLVFSDYMRPAVRLAAIQQVPSPSCGPTTRSASARTARPTSRSSTCRAARDPGPRRRAPRRRQRDRARVGPDPPPRPARPASP